MAMRRDGMYWERDPREMRSKSRLQSLACRKISSCRVQKRICFLIQEAQTLGCAVIASDCAGNREQIVDGEDGLLCTLTPEGIAEKVEELLDDPKKRERLAAAAKQKMNGQTEEIWKLLNLMK